MSPAEASETASDGSARVGQVLDRRYRLDEVVGEGGMAHVYRVTHTMIGKSLAAKIVRPELSNDEEVVRRFLREAQIVSSIKHPNVVDVSDFGETPEGGAFCVMELLRGETLADRIDRDGALQPDEALGVALQLCQGLSAAHEAGVVHRDLKPQNVFICDAKEGKDPVIKLIDFGEARAGRRITVAGAVLGTPEYMAPEQVRGEAIDAGADLYALGVMLFEMLTAMVPFRSDDVARTMQSHLYADPPAMEVADPSLSHLTRTQAVVFQLMAKARAERPDDAVEASELIQRAIEADLGEEAAARVVRSTVAIGSGGIAHEAADDTAPAAAPGGWNDRKMGWGAEAEDAAAPVDPTPAPVRAIDETTMPAPAGAKVPLGLVVALSAAIAGLLTAGGYYMLLAPQTAARSSSVAGDAEVLAGPAPRTPASASRSAGDERPVAVGEVGGAAKPGLPEAPADPGAADDSETSAAAAKAETAKPPAPEPKPSVDRSPTSSPTKRRRRHDAPSKAGSKSRPPAASKDAAHPAASPSGTTPPPTEQPSSQSKPAEPKAPVVPPPAGDLKDPFGRK